MDPQKTNMRLRTCSTTGLSGAISAIDSNKLLDVKAVALTSSNPEARHLRTSLSNNDAAVEQLMPRRWTDLAEIVIGHHVTKT